jgi:hypothetical protein
MAIQLIVGQGVTHNRIFLRKCARWSKVWSPHETWKVEAQGGEGIRIYWVCELCHRTGMTPELEAKLQR